jgi:choline dehydrogenase-like flavoprotein
VKQDSFDVVVIGSGFGGAVASCRLSQAGFRVQLLERGRRYEQNDIPPLPSSERLLPDLRRWAWQSEQGLWDIQDLDELISVQAAGYGGGSLIYANVHLRPPPSVFGAEWPVQFQQGELERYFDLAAYMLDVAPVDPARFPKTSTMRSAARGLGREQGFFLPPLAVNYEEKQANAFGERQSACDGCGKCCSGCSSRAKNTLDLNYLSLAEQNGASVRTQCEVTRIVHDEHADEASRWIVDYVDHLSATRGQVRARDVFLCAGSVHSTRLLKEAHLPGSCGDVQERVGLGYFPNADAVSIIYDTLEEHEPSSGPTITTTTLHWGREPDRFFMIQDGGYSVELERLMGLLRAPLWAGRNRLSSAAANGAHVDAASPASELPGVALLSPVDALLDAVSGGALGGLASGQLKGGASTFLRELGRPLLMSSIVSATIERGARARQTERRLTGWIAERFGIDHWLLRGERAVLRQLSRWGLGDALVIGDHALRAILQGADGDRNHYVREVLGYDATRARRRVMLLAMGRDAAPGALVYDAANRRWSADLDLFRLASGYSEQERLMGDIAGVLGGELRVNPAFAFLGKPITVHSQGGCSMSSEPARGVTQPDGQVHGCPGLYVLDGSILCRSVGVNPSATILALAEHHVLQFIRRRRDASWPRGSDTPGAHEYARHWAGAARWRAKADAAGWALAPPPAPRVRIKTRPLGLSFREVMQGFLCEAPEACELDRPEPSLADDAQYRRFESRGRPDQPLVVRLVARVPDLSVFFEDYRHRLEIGGFIEVALPSLKFKGLCRGELELFVRRTKERGLGEDLARVQSEVSGTEYTTFVGPPSPSEERLMRYDLRFGRGEWRLEGYKRIRQDPGIDAWRDTSALFTRVSRAQPDGSWRALAAGVIHVDLTGFLYDQLPSFKVTGTRDPARVSWAIAKFGSFFFGALQRVYVPEAGALLQTLFKPRAGVRYLPTLGRPR